MHRYVFFSTNGANAKTLIAAKNAARDLGATVVDTYAGSMLVEATPAMAEQVAHALPGWRCNAESKTACLPERHQRQRGVRRPLNVGIAFSFVERRTAAAEDELDRALSRIRAHRESDPDHKKAIQAFIDSEVAFASEDPMENATGAGEVDPLFRKPGR